MGFLSQPVVAVLFLLTFVVFVHELGHFLLSKWLGVGVEVFSVGFGPKLMGFTWNHTEYRLSLLPLGGYVKLAGALPSEEVPSHFRGKELFRLNPYGRSLIILAGPFANLLLAVCIFAGFGWQGIHSPAPILGGVRSDGAAAVAGLKAGDEILEINAIPVRNWEDLHKSISISPGIALDVKYRRKGVDQRTSLTPVPFEEPNPLGSAKVIGRASITAGVVPPIVTVDDRSKEAYQKGIRTGDRILSLDADGWAEPIKISSWSELVGSLELAQSAQVTLVHLEVLSLENSLKKNIDVKALTLSELGLSDSQLTVLAVEDSNLKSQLQFGDKLLEWNGKPVSDIFDVMNELEQRAVSKVSVKLQRDEKLQIVDLELEPVEGLKAGEQVTFYRFNVNFLGMPEAGKEIVVVYDSLWSALGYGVAKTSELASKMLEFLRNLVIGEASFRGLGGPVMMMKVAQVSAQAGWNTYWNTVALISINLGLINLLPLPALDGGQQMIAFLEMIRRRPLKEATFIKIQQFGFFLFLILFVVSTSNDLRLFMGGFVKGLFGG